MNSEEALRSLRGSYLPLHDEEQRRIPLMASQLNVASVHSRHQQNAADRFEEIHFANKELKAKLAEFTACRRAWNRKPRRETPPPYNAIADFDKPSMPPVSNRELYRTNAKLFPPARSCYDTSNLSSLFIRDPMNNPRSQQVLPPPSESEDNMSNASEAEDPLAHVKLLSPAEMRTKLYEMEHEIESIMADAKMSSVYD